MSGVVAAAPAPLTPSEVATASCFESVNPPFAPVFSNRIDVSLYDAPSSIVSTNGSPSPTAKFIAPFFYAAPENIQYNDSQQYPLIQEPDGSFYGFVNDPDTGDGEPSNSAATTQPFVITIMYTPQGTNTPVKFRPGVVVNVPLANTCKTQNQTFASAAPGDGPASVVGMASSNDGQGYWMVGADGRVYAYGDSESFTPPHTGYNYLSLSHPIVGMAATPDGAGYWLVASDGGVFTFGDAGFFGSTGALSLNKPIVGMAATIDGRGYWLVASDGGIFAFGDAKFEGSTGGMHLNKPVVGMAADRASGGYWLVASDGGVFSFNAPFHGSTGALKLNKPIVGMEAAPSGAGYRFVATDGGVFCFGEPFAGSTGNLTLQQPISGIAASGAGGYWLGAADGGVFSFGVPFLGSAA
jgi:hypothetical protein